MERRYRVGLVGAGDIAKKIYLSMLKSRSDVELIGVVTKNYENAAAIARDYGIAHAVRSVEELIELHPDCAFVLSPKEYHPEHVKKLMRAGVDVFCEKPMGCSLQEAREMVEVQKETGRLLLIGFNRRYAPVYRKAKEIFKDQAPDVIIAQKNRPASEWRATLENAIHMVDIMRYICGECVSVQAYSRKNPDLPAEEQPFYETLTTAQLKFENGTVGMLVADRASGQWMETMELHGGNKSVCVNCPDSITVTDGEGARRTDMTPLAFGWAQVQDKMGFAEEVDHFFACMKDPSIELISSAGDCYKTHELMDRILREAGLPDLQTKIDH